jgi:hypothetical protein
MPKANARPIGHRTVAAVVCSLLAAALSPARVVAGTESGDGVVRFVYADSAAQQVSLVGDFNGWSPTATPMDRESAGVWVTQVFMDPGTYEYKFLVDGDWRTDPDNSEISENGNSVVRVGPGGSVLPPAPTVAAGDTTQGGLAERLRWNVRYLGKLTARRSDGNYTLDRPLHDVDLRIDIDFGAPLAGWFLTNFNNLDEGVELSRTSLRYDRGVILWKPPAFDLHLFDHEGVTDWEDPGNLVGNIGIYGDAFGYQRRGVMLRRGILGAPLEFLYADDIESESPLLTQGAFVLPDSFVGQRLDLLAQTDSYLPADSDRNGDALAFRFRAGHEDQGLGFGYRLDRGEKPGTLLQVAPGTDSLGAFARGFEYATTETWDGWSLDLRLRPRVPIIAQYMSGDRVARARSAVPVETRVDTAGADETEFGSRTESDVHFDLDSSRRALVQVGTPGKRRNWEPLLTYWYQQDDLSQFVTGTPFLMRDNGVGLELEGSIGGARTQLLVEQDWFDYPQGAEWETQFWFRKHNFWLDESTAGYDRFTLLGADRGARARVEVDRQLWAARDLRGSLRFTAASPGFDRPPRYFETVLRFGVQVGWGLELRTHSRFATYRRFETADPTVVALLGPGLHVEAGELANRDYADASHDYRTFAANFIELVYPIAERTDISLGFGVDPWVVYEVRNTYMDIGWDQFLFDAGASPDAAFRDPIRLGQRMENAERALESERRLQLEARVNF